MPNPEGINQYTKGGAPSAKADKANRGYQQAKIASILGAHSRGQYKEPGGVKKTYEEHAAAAHAASAVAHANPSMETHMAASHAHQIAKQAAVEKGNYAAAHAHEGQAQQHDQAHGALFRAKHIRDANKEHQEAGARGAESARRAVHLGGDAESHTYGMGRQFNTYKSSHEKGAELHRAAADAYHAAGNAAKDAYHSKLELAHRKGAAAGNDLVMHRQAVEQFRELGQHALADSHDRHADSLLAALNRPRRGR